MPEAVIVLSPWGAAALAFGLLTAGGVAGLITTAILSAGVRGDNRAAIARAYRKGFEAGRALGEQNRPTG